MRPLENQQDLSPFHLLSADKNWKFSVPFLGAWLGADEIPSLPPGHELSRSPGNRHLLRVSGVDSEGQLQHIIRMAN